MFYFVAGLLVAVVSTYLVRAIARRLRVLDRPDAERKLHKAPVPLLGGVAIFCSFWLVIGLLYWLKPNFLGINLLAHQLIVTFVATLCLLVLGVADDVRPLPVTLRLVVTALAALFVAAAGLSLTKLTNPLGGTPLALGYAVSVLLVFCWIMGMTYAVKISDGIDGLATGIVAIASIMIAALAATKTFYQPNVGLIALIFVGALVGFLIFNFYPASIFLGESGSLFLGFMLGVLAVIAGSKVATALLVMAVPVLDLGRVMFVRYRQGKSIFHGDRLHLHYALLRRGLRERQVVLLFYAAAIIAGGLALLLQSAAKIFVLLLLIIAAVALTSRWRLTS